MIQRIQTLYLVLAILLSVLLVFFKLTLATMASATGNYALNSVSVLVDKNGVVEAVISSFPIAGAVMLGVFLSVYGIMQFKNRKFQAKLVQAALVVQLVIGGLVFFFADKMATMDATAKVSYSPILALLLVNIVLYYLAIRGIKSDEALVRSADRLR